MNLFTRGKTAHDSDDRKIAVRRSTVPRLVIAAAAMMVADSGRAAIQVTSVLNFTQDYAQFGYNAGFGEQRFSSLLNNSGFHAARAWAW
jgi:hypothetical protein